MHISSTAHIWQVNTLIGDCTKCVWKQWPGSILKKKGVLILDSFWGYIRENNKRSWWRWKYHNCYTWRNDIYATTPGCVQLVLKEMYSNCMSKILRPDFNLICYWVKICNKLIVKYFKKCGMSNIIWWYRRLLHL